MKQIDNKWLAEALNNLLGGINKYPLNEHNRGYILALHDLVEHFVLYVEGDDNED